MNLACGKGDNLRGNVINCQSCWCRRQCCVWLARLAWSIARKCVMKMYTCIHLARPHISTLQFISGLWSKTADSFFSVCYVMSALAAAAVHNLHCRCWKGRITVASCGCMEVGPLRTRSRSRKNLFKTAEHFIVTNPMSIEILRHR